MVGQNTHTHSHSKKKKKKSRRVENSEDGFDPITLFVLSTRSNFSACVTRSLIFDMGAG